MHVTQRASTKFIHILFSFSHVSHKELTTIQKHKIIRVAETAERRPVPFRAILTDPAVLGIFTALIGGLLGFQLFAQYGAVYLNKVSNYQTHTFTRHTTADPPLRCSRDWSSNSAALNPLVVRQVHCGPAVRLTFLHQRPLACHHLRQRLTCHDGRLLCRLGSAARRFRTHCSTLLYWRYTL